MFVSISDFTGKYTLSKGMYDNAKLQDYIDRYEPRYLKELLGVELYNLFIADLNGGILQSPNYVKIYEPLSEDYALYLYSWQTYNTVHTIIDSEGIKEMLKGFIYFEYLKDQWNQATPYGMVTQKAENSEVSNNVVSMMYTRYNEAVRTFLAIQEYIGQNINAATGQIISIGITNPGEGYSNMIDVSLIYATEQVTDGGLGAISVQFGGTNYPASGTNIPLTGGVGAGATVDYLASGGVITDVTIVERGSGYNIGDVLYVQDGDLNAEIYVDDWFYTSQLISEPTGSGATVSVESTGVGIIDGQFLSVPGEGYADGEYGVGGGSGSGALFSITVDPLDPLQGVFTLELVEGGFGYEGGDVLYLQGGTVDAEIVVTSVTLGEITSLTLLNKGVDYKVGDVLTVYGGLGVVVEAQFVVEDLGKGYDKFKGVRKLYNYWM
jgi:hypothetical protein